MVFGKVTPGVIEYVSHVEIKWALFDSQITTPKSHMWDMHCKIFFKDKYIYEISFAFYVNINIWFDIYIYIKISYIIYTLVSYIKKKHLYYIIHKSYQQHAWNFKVRFSHHHFSPCCDSTWPCRDFRSRETTKPSRPEQSCSVLHATVEDGEIAMQKKSGKQRGHFEPGRYHDIFITWEVKW